MRRREVRRIGRRGIESKQGKSFPFSATPLHFPLLHLFIFTFLLQTDKIPLQQCQRSYAGSKRTQGSNLIIYLLKSMPWHCSKCDISSCHFKMFPKIQHDFIINLAQVILPLILLIKGRNFNDQSHTEICNFFQDFSPQPNYP